MRYFYAWIPLVVITTLFILILPWLGLIALMVALALVTALVSGFAYVLYRVGRAIRRHYAGRRAATTRTAPSLSPASSHGRPPAAPAGAVFFAGPPSDHDQWDRPAHGIRRSDPMKPPIGDDGLREAVLGELEDDPASSRAGAIRHDWRSPWRIGGFERSFDQAILNYTSTRFPTASGQRPALTISEAAAEPTRRTR